MQIQTTDGVTELTFDSPQECYDFIEDRAGGKIFGATFIKKDGEERTGTWLKSSAVKKDRAGGELAYSPRDKGLYCVYEMVNETDRKDDKWRMISLEGLKALKIGGVVYKVKVMS